MRKFSLAAWLLLLSPALAGAETWKTDLTSALAESTGSGKPVLVDMYADWCGWCKELERQVFSTPRFQEFSKRFVLLRVDTEDRGEGGKLAARFGAYNLPTIVIFDRNLSRLAKIEGFAPTEPYIASIESQLGEHGDYQRRLAAAASLTDPVALRTLAGEAHSRQDGARAAALLRRVIVVETNALSVARLRYLLADALRLGRQFEEAGKELATLRAAAALLRDQDLIERADLLAFNLADDRGNCQQAVSALEDFLRLHPKSGYSGQAAQTLAALRSDKAACT